TLAAVNQLVSTVRAVVDRLDKSGAIDDLGAAASSARRITNEVEKGRGWLHVLVYEEPEALRRLNAILISAESLMARTESGGSAAGGACSGGKRGRSGAGGRGRAGRPRQSSRGEREAQFRRGHPGKARGRPDAVREHDLVSRGRAAQLSPARPHTLHDQDGR